MKKTGIFPLAGMILCSMVSLSSGLKYETNIFPLLLSIAFNSVLYYTVYRFIKVENAKKRRNYSFLVSIGANLFFFLLFMKFMISGFQNIETHLLKLADECYSLGWIIVPNNEEEYVSLTFFAVAGVVTLLSLWFYEKGEMLWIAALPSFCLFCLPLAVDGTPEEWCIVGYGVAFALLLSVGKEGNLSRLFLAVGLAAGIIIVGLFGKSWTTVRPFVREYRDYVHTALHLTSVGRGEEEEEKVQEIDFGKYDKDGSIEYEGINALNVYAPVDLRYSIVYLRGFVGNDYKDDQWDGDKQKRGDSMGMVTVRQRLLEIQQAADKDMYYGYVMDQQMPKQYGKKKILYSGEDSRKISRRYLAVEKELKENLMYFDVGPGKVNTIGEAAEKIHTILQNEFQYTLHPGKSRLTGTSELIRFLFNTRAGYCTHYATAAVMMFRAMGIPARLAQGYMVRGEYLKKQEWTPVYDRNAHAWVEIYIPDAGWYPFDATMGVIAQTGEMGPLEDNPLATPTPVPVAAQTADPQGEASELPAEETPKDAENDTEKDTENNTEADAENDTKEDTETDEENDTEEDTETDANTDTEHDRQDSSSEEHRQFQKRIVLGIVLFLTFLAVILLFRAGMYRREYRRKMDNFKKQKDPKNKFLWMHSEWEECLQKLGIPCAYDSYEMMIADFEKGFEKYISAEQRSEFHENTEFYVQCCFTARYGNEGMEEQDLVRCEEYLRFVFSALSENEDQKDWKKIRKCCIVNEVMNKEKKDR